MANYDYYKLQRGHYPSMKPGTNWVHVIIEPAVAIEKLNIKPDGIRIQDNLIVLKTYDGMALQGGFWRCVTTTDGNATADLGTAAGGQQVHAGMDINAAVTDYARLTTPDHAAPLDLDAGYLYWENLGANISTGRIDLLLNIMVPHSAVEDAQGAWT